MGRVLVNNEQLASSIETALGVPGTTFEKLEPNTIGGFGAEIAKVSRNPINADRQRKKGATTDLDSAVDFEADLTYDFQNKFLDGFMFAIWKSNNAGAFFRPSAVTATGYTVASGGALADRTLFVARGFLNAANNGLKVSLASVATEIKPSGAIAEAAIPDSQNATVELAGFRGAASDITVNASGHLTSTLLNFTTLGLTVGQYIWVGGDATLNRFATAADRGFARIKAIAATLLTLEKRGQAFAADVGTGKEIDLFFGRFLRNVAVDHADFLERSYSLELFHKNLQSPGPGDEFEYARGNYANELSFNVPLTDKATAAVGFIGTDTPNPTTVRDTGASSARKPQGTVAYNTSANVMRLRLQETDETVVSTDFKNATATLANNIGPEKVIGILGARFMNTGNFEVQLEAQLLLSNSAVISAIRANRTMTIDWAVRNEDGTLLMDLPSVMIEGGGKDFPENESLLINTTVMAFEDPALGYTCSFSQFPYSPAS
jgi:hypothetical protein